MYHIKISVSMRSGWTALTCYQQSEQQNHLMVQWWTLNIRIKAMRFLNIAYTVSTTPKVSTKFHMTFLNI